MTEIEKMAEVIATAIVGDTADNEDTQSSIPLATALYKQGYRKQSDLVREFADKLTKAFYELEQDNYKAVRKESAFGVMCAGHLVYEIAKEFGAEESRMNKRSETVKEFAEKIMDKNCRNCEHAFLETCKGCNTLQPNNTYENFELRKDITAEKHRADVAEEALKLACQQLGYELHLFGVNKNIVVEPRIIEFKEQAEARLKELSKEGI